MWTLCQSTCPSVHSAICGLLSETLPFVRFSSNSVQELFTKSCQTNMSLMKISLVVVVFA